MKEKKNKNLFRETFKALGPVKIRLNLLFQKSEEGTLEPNEEEQVRELKRALDIFAEKIKVCQTNIRPG